MSSDTANLLRAHVEATAQLINNVKPDQEEKGNDGATSDNDSGGSAGGPERK